MKSTVDLFGNVPRMVWRLQYRLAVWRMELAKKRLNELMAVDYLCHNTEAINGASKAHKFWEALRDEANESLRSKK